MAVGSSSSPRDEPLERLMLEQRVKSPEERNVELEKGLKRISNEIEELRVRDHGAPDSSATSRVATAGLTPRQREVVQRLVDGERVPAIARSIFLSQSTVRNHLLAAYRKFDVHTQEELIEVFRGDRPS